MKLINYLTYHSKKELYITKYFPEYWNYSLSWTC